jgi:hypothetical protein
MCIGVQVRIACLGLTYVCSFVCLFDPLIFQDKFTSALYRENKNSENKMSDADCLNTIMGIVQQNYVLIR